MSLDYRRVASFLGHPSNGSITGSDVLTMVRDPSFPPVAWDAHAYDWKPADILGWSGVEAPTATSLVPPTATIGDPDFTLHVHGTGFTEGAVILWNGGREPTTFVSATEVTTGVNMATAQFPMPIPVAVELADGVIMTNELTFDLLPAAVATAGAKPEPARKR